MMIGKRGLEKKDCPRVLRRSNAPVAVENPGALLAFFAAVLGPPAPTALGELAGVFFPLAALVVRALSDAASRVVFPA